MSTTARRSRSRAGQLAVAIVLATTVAASAQDATPPQSSASISEDRVEVILGILPIKGTPQYHLIVNRLGDSLHQVLPLTGCEVWHVRRSLIPELEQVAKAQNVSFKILDETWNKVLAPMEPTAAMEPKVKAMVDQAMKSSSTASVGMMSTRYASMVEYAFIKGLKDKTADESTPAAVHIALGHGKEIKALRHSVAIEGDRLVWRGVVEGRESPVTILWWPSGRLTGNIHIADRVYQLKMLNASTIGVVETITDKLPDEHPRPTAARMKEMQKRSDRSFMPSEAAGRPGRDDTQNERDDAGGQKGGPQVTPRATPESTTSPVLPDQRADAGKAFTAAAGERLQAAAQAPVAAQADVTIDVLVAYTAKAAAHYGDINLDLIEITIADAQQSFKASGIDNVKVRLVGTHQVDYDETTGEHFDHVWRMVDKGDGYLEELHPLRDAKKADVVVLIVDDNRGCGLATRVAAEAEEAFAVVHHECAATSYTLAHEIGHIIGARHDRIHDTTAIPFPYGHGYVDTNKRWRDMMSYKAACDGCPRLPIWSSPTIRVRGGPGGDDLHDNARVIRENAARVANFR